MQLKDTRMHTYILSDVFDSLSNLHPKALIILPFKPLILCNSTYNTIFRRQL